MPEADILTHDELVSLLKQHRTQCDAIQKNIEQQKANKKFATGGIRRSYEGSYPYEVPCSKLVFKDISDEINTRGFHATYPQSYTPIPNYFLHFKVDPFFSPTEDEDFARGSVTIAGMIEMTDMKMPWRLSRDEDIPIIIELVERYVANMAPFAASSLLVKAYLIKCNKFLEIMRAGQRRMLRRRKDIKPSINFLNILQKLTR